jgi:hypothetical protein
VSEVSVSPGEQQVLRFGQDDHSLVVPLRTNTRRALAVHARQIPTFVTAPSLD